MKKLLSMLLLFFAVSLFGQSYYSLHLGINQFGKNDMNTKLHSQGVGTVPSQSSCWGMGWYSMAPFGVGFKATVSTNSYMNEIAKGDSLNLFHSFVSIDLSLLKTLLRSSRIEIYPELGAGYTVNTIEMRANHMPEIDFNHLNDAPNNFSMLFGRFHFKAALNLLLHLGQRRGAIGVEVGQRYLPFGYFARQLYGFADQSVNVRNAPKMYRSHSFINFSYQFKISKPELY